VSRVRKAINAALQKTTGYVLTKADSRGSDARRQGLATKNRRAGRGGDRPGLRVLAMPPDLASRALESLQGLSMDQLSLTEIANLAGTDKGTIGPSAGWHANNYADIYEAYLESLRDRPINLLEVGLGVPGANWDARIAHGRNKGGGASLRMWYGYFPQARIFGADINSAAHLDNDRIQTYVVDQGDPDSINGFLDAVGDVRFDVIVDDGSHRPDHQQITLGCLFPRLKPGGLYIIEDLFKNGKGDRRTNRIASDDVLNTRRVLKHFHRYRVFEEPHAISGPDEVAADIHRIGFHAPRPWRGADSEAVCVIRKV
jgi:hypothetical protein